MPGGILEQIKSGSPDLFLTNNPEITYFTSVYRRYTNFSVESNEINFDDQIGFGRTSIATIPRLCDLIYKVYIKANLPAIQITRYVDPSLTKNYQDKITLAEKNYQSVLNYMYINISGYRNGINTLNIENSTLADAVASILNSFNIFNTDPTVKNTFIAVLAGTSFNYFSIALDEVVNNLETNATKTSLTIKLSSVYTLCQNVAFYYLNKINVAKNMLNENTNTNAKISWIKRIGHYIFSTMWITIGGQTIDRHYSDWLNIWYELTTDIRNDSTYFKMIGNVSALYTPTRIQLPAYTLYIPLQFWFCRHSGLALPLIALQYHDVAINVTARKASECIYYSELTQQQLNDPVQRQQAIQDLQLLNIDQFVAINNIDISATLYVDCIYLDSAERIKFAQSRHEYLIEQLQYYDIVQTNNINNTIQLNFNNACKEIFWIALDNSKFVVTDCFDPLEPMDYSTIVSKDIFKTTYKSDILYTNAVTKGKIITSPILNSTLNFSGQERVLKISSSYYNLIQPYQVHTRIPNIGINCYSFSLYPEEFQPSGSANLSRLNVYLTLELYNPNNTVFDIRAFGLNYNVMRIISGMANVILS